MRCAKGLLISMLVLASSLAYGEDDVYIIKDKAGHIHFSDKQPYYHAEPLMLERLQTYLTPVKVTQKPPAKPEVKTDNLNYQISVTEPVNETSVRANNGNVTVNISVSPALQEGHLIVLRDNGKPVGEPSTQTSFALENLPRGQHTITVEIVEKDKVLATAESVFYVQRRSVILNP